MDPASGNVPARVLANGSAQLPSHLRRFVVEQDYAQYTALDQAVWRFVLLQMHARLAETAHPIYREGLAATGISVDRIPRIEEMNDRLSRFGWGAVCVDGFIPPRAFQELQACGLLPIAGAIRTRQHLAYTPAPDIIHEAAGHAPILAEPVFAAYLRRIGELGAQAFTLPEEERVFQAVYQLSEIKEAPGASADAVADAETELAAALAGAAAPSEAALLSRLYWWTAEYGLVGRVDDYKLYGAGLLSSLGESHSCHAPAVRKRVLDESCIEVGYDITRPQPLLFVAPSFEALHDVLEGVARTLAVNIGGAVALARALQSRERASIEFSSGAWAMGTLSQVGPPISAGTVGNASPAWLAFDGAPERLVVLGRLDDGRAVVSLDSDAIGRCRDARTDRHGFRFASGATVEGRLETVGRAPDGRLMQIQLGAAEVRLPGRAPTLVRRFVLLAAGDIVRVHAGAIAGDAAADAACAVCDFSGAPDLPESRTLTSVELVPVKVPRPRRYPPRERQLLELYVRAERAHRADPRLMRAVFLRTHALLAREFPDEWLLRWNLLESLRRAVPARGAIDSTGIASTLEETLAEKLEEKLEEELEEELERLEIQFDHREPIASGLRYLAREKVTDK